MVSVSLMEIAAEISQVLAQQEIRSQAVARIANRSLTADYPIISDCCIASPAAFEILRYKHIGVTSLTFWDHMTP